MHKVIVPKLSSIHRFACLALYRALLRQCNKLPSKAPKLTAVKSHIQERFHRYKNLQSPSQTRDALEAGYEAFDLLHSVSQGNKRHAKVITNILSEAQSIKKRKIRQQKFLAKQQPVKQVSERQRKKEENRRHQEMTARRHPDAIPILSRPRPRVKGRRHVPVLVSARGVPFLRIKKPQPRNLTGVIQTKLNKRWKRIERRERLETELLFGQDEDHWDCLTIGQQEDTWATEIQTALQDVNQVIRHNDIKNIKLAEAMWNVVLAEGKLVEEEKQKSTRSSIPTT